MISAADFQQLVLDWFVEHGRHDLPWQVDRSPYRVWLSEIMLQQTQVKTVIPYFQRFIEHYPDVEALAQAGEDEVLHLWTGLGYYARARNLLKCARAVVDQHGGRFPESVDELETLPGIGRSTAGAIVSQAMEQRAAILDGNVKRVLARYAAVEGWPGQSAVHKQLWELAESLTPPTRCRDYTQAMMDLGATVCTRRNPQCGRCPLADACAGRRSGDPHRFPGRKPRRELPVKATTMLIIRNATGEIYLRRRPSEGIWGGLWSFPEVEGRQEGIDLCLDHFGLKPEQVADMEPLRHTFSHYHLDIQPLELRLGASPTAVAEPGQSLWYRSDRPEAVGMAAPVVRLLKRLQS